MSSRTLSSPLPRPLNTCPRRAVALAQGLLLPSTATAFPYARRAKPRLPPTKCPEKDAAGDDGDAAPPADTHAWQREKIPSELPRSPTIPFQPRWQCGKLKQRPARAPATVEGGELIEVLIVEACSLCSTKCQIRYPPK